MKSIGDSLYHRVLRVAAVVCAVVLLFESGMLIESTKILSLNTHEYIATAVGVGGSVEPTELNTLTAELTAQKQALLAREDALREREIEIGLASGSNDTATYALAGVLFVLLVLIILNYALDYLRAREPRTSEQQLKTV